MPAAKNLTAKNITKEAMVKKSETIAHSPVVLPAASPEEAKKAWASYEALKQAVLDEKNDVQVIQGKNFLKKSYWRKIATFFNLSVEVVEERREDIGKNVVFHFVCKAIAPNGRFAIGSGSADIFEKGYRNSYHNVRATAETRAFNRAVSNLVGGGEVSAEEVEQVSEPNASSSDKAYASDPQKRMIFALSKGKGIAPEKAKEDAKKKFGLKSFKDLTRAQARELIEVLQS